MATNTLRLGRSAGLFDNLAGWLASPYETFVTWIDLQPTARSTADVKRYMWQKWCRWMKDHHLSLDRVDDHHVARFIKESRLEKAHRQRYVLLIENVYIHLHFLGLSMPNPGTTAAYRRVGSGKNDPTHFLEHDEDERLRAVILDALSTPSVIVSHSEESKKKRRGRERQGWLAIRDAALAGVMIGGGATVLAVERMTVSCTNSDEGKIHLPAKGKGYDAILLPIGQMALDVWMRRRRELGPLIADCLFPADQSRNRHASTEASMSPSSIFRAVRGVLATAGITGARACGQTLRNTYGGTLINLGFKDEELAKAMGFADVTSAIRLRAAWRSSREKAAETVLPAAD